MASSSNRGSRGCAQSQDISLGKEESVSRSAYDRSYSSIIQQCNSFFCLYIFDSSLEDSEKMHSPRVHLSWSTPSWMLLSSCALSKCIVGTSTSLWERAKSGASQWTCIATDRLLLIEAARTNRHYFFWYFWVLLPHIASLTKAIAIRDDVLPVAWHESWESGHCTQVSIEEIESNTSLWAVCSILLGSQFNLKSERKVNQSSN